MAIHSPDIFHNTIAVASIHAVGSLESVPEYDTPYQIISTTPSQTITPKNIKYTLTALRFIAEWRGYYLVTFNATASGGEGGLFYFEPYLNAQVLGYGNVFYFQQITTEGVETNYEISSTFIVNLKKDDYIDFYNTLKTEELEEPFAFKNIQTTIYQLEQVGIH